MPEKDKNKPEPNKSQHLDRLSGKAVKEMRAAIDDAWNNPDPAVRARQRMLFPDGKPSPAEFIRVMTEQVKKGL